MTDEEKLKMFRGICGYTEDKMSDDSLSAYLSIAKDVVIRKAYQLTNDVSDIPFPSKYDTVQVQIANELLQKQGAEGETGHTESGVTRQYETAGISSSLMNQIIPFAKVPGASNETT